MNYILCVDLGSINDYTTLGVIELIGAFQENERIVEQLYRETEIAFISKYELRQLERMPLGTTYPEVISRVKTLLNSPQLYNKTSLVVDATGVGVAVLQMMRASGLNPFGVTITGGSTIGRNNLGYTVPKMDLITTLQLILQGTRLQISKGIKHGPELIHEVRNFKIKRKGSHETMEAWRESDHDDLVICLAIGLWFGEKVLGGNHTVNIDDEDEYDPLRSGLFD